MQKAKDILDRQYMEMRWRIVSLAADIDRLQRAENGSLVLESDPRIKALQECITELQSVKLGRAERVQMILSDKTPAPGKL